METKHTPTPWFAIPNPQLGENDYCKNQYGIYVDRDCSIRVQPRGRLIAIVGNGRACGVETAKANAAFIVQAVNAHDALVAACKAAETRLTWLTAWFAMDPKDEVRQKINGDIGALRAALAVADE